MTTFEELCGTDAEWCTTLAYWLGTYRGGFDGDSLVALGRAMGLQYDFEEQADRYGSALPEENDWTKTFAPVAPVQLASAWSPLARAVKILGEPTIRREEQGEGARMVVAAWDARRVSEVKAGARNATQPDDKRFIGLLGVAVGRAQAKRRGVFLAAKPGWSYEHDTSLTPETVQLMTASGFVVATRKP